MIRLRPSLSQHYVSKCFLVVVAIGVQMSVLSLALRLPLVYSEHPQNSLRTGQSSELRQCGHS